MNRCWLAGLLVIAIFATAKVWAQKPALSLLHTHHSQNVIGWVMSEKLDGIRAYWDGQALWTRGGVKLAPPESFTNKFPPFALDGELWTRRGDYERIQSIVMDRQASEAWREVSYQIFEVPDQPGGLLERLNTLKEYLTLQPLPQVRIIAQHPITNLASLQDFEAHVLAQGGEGLVLKDPAQPYQTGRLAHALKRKPSQDDECLITGFTAGKGKYSGQVGALRCDWVDAHGVTRPLKIGSGLNDALRQFPPAIGQRVTFSHQGLTAKGLPRHPVFMRIRRVD